MAAARHCRRVHVHVDLEEAPAKGTGQGSSLEHGVFMYEHETVVATGLVGATRGKTQPVQLVTPGISGGAAEFVSVIATG